MTCPICRARTQEKYRPFCSKRCADIDLGRWMSGAYVIETDETPDPSEAAPDGRHGDPEDRG